MFKAARFVFVNSILIFTWTISVANAQVSISEIMYDPISKDDKGYEWIEVINVSGESVDLTGFRFIENDVKHFIKAKGEKILSPGEAVVIVQDYDKFLEDFPDYDGKIFRSVFSLQQKNNAGESLSLYKTSDKVVIETIHYSPKSIANGTGASIHIDVDGSQISAPATPGIIAINPIVLTDRRTEMKALPKEEIEILMEEEKIQDVLEGRTITREISEESDGHSSEKKILESVVDERHLDTNKILYIENKGTEDQTPNKNWTVFHLIAILLGILIVEIMAFIFVIIKK